jgi:tetratricopeptide (TPR) repeat protein
VEQILAVLERKPLYRRPAPMVAMAACLALAVLVIPVIIEFTTPAPIRLAVLPVDSPSDLDQSGQRILEDVAKRVRRMQAGKATISVIPPSKVLSKDVVTPQEAKRVFGATHAMQLKLYPEGDGVDAEGMVIDLSTMSHVNKDFRWHFAKADLADLPTGLTGFISWALHVHRTLQPETVAPAAAAAYKTGREYLDRQPHDFVNAAREFREAARLDPHSPLPAAGLAEARTREFQTRKDERAGKEAQLWLARAEALNADSPAVRMASGLLHQIRGDYPRAIDDYQRAKEIDSGNVEAMLGVGFAYESQGVLDKAVKNYDLAISKDPNNYRPYEYLGAFYYFRGRYAEAEEPYRKAVERAPDRVDTYGTLAAIYTAEFKYAEAETMYKALLQQKESALTLNNLGGTLAFQGRQQEAMDYYRRAVTLNPSRAIYLINLGDAQRRVKDHADAQYSYQRGLRLVREELTANTANASARAYLAYLLARLGFKGEARRQIAEAMNSPAKDDQIMLCAVETYEALGDRERSLAAAAMATPQTRAVMNHHPDLADLQQNPRFKKLIAHIQ